MPVIQSAIKKMRRDARRTEHNDLMRARLRDTMRKVRKGTTTAPEAYAVVDKSAKLNLLHPNKAARLKSRIAKALPAKSSASTKKAVPAKRKASSKATKSAAKKKSSPKKAS